MNGRLYSVGDNGELATEVIGRWVRINTVHDVGAGIHQIYIDGVLKVTKTGARQVAWYNKYGSYRLGSGHGPITVEWRNTRFWKDGRSEGGPPAPPPADAGAPPTPPDAAGTPDVSASPDVSRPEPEDARTEGTGGAPPDARKATGGSSGNASGGSSGTASGGSGGSEDSPDADEAPPPRKRTSGGCTLAGDRPSGPLVLVLVLGLFRRWTRPRSRTRGTGLSNPTSA
jgi:hypothetical protein